MKKLAVLPFLLLFAALTIAGAAAPAPATARCATIGFVLPTDRGLYHDADCTISKKPNIRSKVKNTGGMPVNNALECVEVEEPNTEQGNWKEDTCSNKGPVQRFVLAVIASRFEWAIGESTMYGKGLATESVSYAQKSETEFTLEGKLLGIVVVIKAKKLSSESAQIVEAGTDSGTLVFSELSVTKPSGCSITSPLKTKALKTELAEVKGTPYDKFMPAEGSTVASIVISGCAITGSYSLTGSFYGQVEPLTTELSSQPVTFSKAINEAAGGALFFGKEPVSLGGQATYSLSGENSGEKFGAY